MSADRAFRVPAALAAGTTLLTFGLIVLGSVVRTTGSGLACPDWPLCEGRLIPRLQFNVLIEWSHRFVALIVSVAIATLAVLAWTRRAQRARLGALAGLAVGLLAAQVMLGALTVWRLLDPSIVSGHLGVALLLFATLVALTHAARRGAAGLVAAPPARPARLLPLFAAATALTYAQALLGGMVSTNHAGLACPDWPTCFGEWFPPLEGLIGLQMLHRYGAYLLTAVLLAVAAAARTAPLREVRVAGRAALGLVAAQVVLGVANVELGLSVALSAAHLGVAAALLAVLLSATLRLAALPRAVAADPAFARGATAGAGAP